MNHCGKKHANSIHVWNSCQCRVGPETFEVVKLSGLGKEDMHKNVAIVDGHPLIGAQSHDMRGLLASLTAFVAHRFGNSLHLRRRLSLTDDKVLSDGSVDLAKVADDNVASLLFLNTFSDGFN